MYLDMKCSVWERFELTDEEASVIENMIKNGACDKDIRNVLLDIDSETLQDTFTYINKDENDGYPTIELFDDNSEIIVTN